MPSQYQVQFHNQNEEAARQAEAERQQRLMQDQATLQANRDNQQFGNQQQLAQQAGQQQQQQNALLNAYQQQRDYRMADIGSQQQYQQAFYGQQAATQQEQFQTQRDQNLAGYQMQQATHQANLQANLHSTMLSQEEERRMSRLQRSLGAVDDAVRRREIMPEEGAQLRIEIETGLNPLMNRARQAQIMQAQVQTQGMYQQNEIQADLHTHRMNYLNRGLQGNLQTVIDPHTGVEQLMFVNERGEPQVLDFGRAQQQHMLNMAQGVQGIEQRGQLFPEQLQHARLSNEQLVAHTRSIASSTQRAEGLHPLQAEGMRVGIEREREQIRGMAQEYEFRGQEIPLALRQRAATLDNMEFELSRNRQMFPRQLEHATLENQSLTQGIRQRGEMFPRQLEHATLSNQATAQAIRQSGELFPEQVAHLRATTGLAREQVEELRQRIRANPTEAAIVQHQVDSLATMRHQISTELNHRRDAASRPNPLTGVAPELPDELHPRNHDAVVNETLIRAVESSNRDRPDNRRLPVPFPLPRPGPAAAPVVPAPGQGQAPVLDVEQRAGASTVTALRVQQLAHLHEVLPPQDAGPRAFGNPSDRREAADMRAASAIIQRAATENRGLTAGEVNDYLRLQQSVAAVNPEMGRALSLTATPQQNVRNVPIERLTALQEEAGRLWNSQGFLDQAYGYGATRHVGDMWTLLNSAVDREGNRRNLNGPEVKRYLSHWHEVNRMNPAWAESLRLHRN